MGRRSFKKSQPFATGFFQRQTITGTRLFAMTVWVTLPSSMRCSPRRP
jgi:hypothetical protein